MRTTDRPAWEVNMDVPQILQFAAYVGQGEGFAVPDSVTATPYAPAEAEWRDWWQFVIRHTADVNTSIALFARAPEFEPLANKPLLLELCRRHWQGFLEDWRRGKRPLVDKLQAQTRALNVQETVKQQERRLGRPVRDFCWRLDFTRWPQDYRRDVAEDHTILGVGYLETPRLNDLRAVAESRISVLA